MAQSTLTTNPTHLFKKAKKAFMDGDFSAALKVYYNMVKEQPANTKALTAFLEALYESDQLHQSLPYANLALKHAANNADCLAWAAMIFYHHKYNDVASQCLEKARALDPNNPLPYAVVAFYKCISGQIMEAGELAKQALKLDPKHPIALRVMWRYYEQQNQITLAIDYCRQSLKHNPHHYASLHNLACLYINQGMLKNAVPFVQKILSIHPDDIFALITLESIQKPKSTDDALIIKIKNTLTERLTKESDSDAKGKIAKLQFTLGDAANRRDDFKEAFQYYSAGNKTLCTISPAVTYEMMENLSSCDERHFFPYKTFSKAQENPDKLATLPIFVTGVPRCGSTLIEQVITSHSEVESIGESGQLEHFIINRICANKDVQSSYPAILESFSKKQIEDMAHEYLVSRQSSFPKAKHILDKTLLNSLHHGMIRLLFPNAKIIHCRRHPLDVCLSNFSKNFTEGANYSNDMEVLAAFYKQYHIITKRFEKIIPSDFVHNVYYEAFIGNFESEARALLDFCDLEWQPQCLEFYKNKHYVKTASKFQIRQPIYQTAKYRWKNYEPYIEPLLEALKDEVAEYESALQTHINQ